MASHKTNTKRLTERVANPLAGARVDREAGVIRNVLVCGFTSANGRDYPVSVFRRDFAKYENRPVNFDHARDGTVSRRGGWLQDVKLGADGRPRGDLHLLKTHPNYGPVMEAAERHPALFGLSHVAMCRTTTKNGREVVEAIERVESIDIVADPATTNGFFESTGRQAVPFSRKQLVEWLAKHPTATTKTCLAVKRLGEMDGMGMDAPAMDAPPAEDADPDNAVMDAFKMAISDVVDKAMAGGLNPKEALGKIKKLLASHCELNNDGTTDTDDNPETNEDDEYDEYAKAKAPESRTRPKWSEVIQECNDAGLECDLDHVGALLEIVGAAARKATIEVFKRTAEGRGERPQAAGRERAGATLAREGKSATTAEPTVEEMKARLKG